MNRKLRMSYNNDNTIFITQHKSYDNEITRLMQIKKRYVGAEYYAIQLLKWITKMQPKSLLKENFSNISTFFLSLIIAIKVNIFI